MRQATIDIYHWFEKSPKAPKDMDAALILIRCKGDSEFTEGIFLCKTASYYWGHPDEGYDALSDIEEWCYLPTRQP